MKRLLIGFLVIGSTSAFASFPTDRFQLGTIDKIEVLKNKDIKLSYTLPCEDLDFETFTAASDDSGDMEVKVGVVYNCVKGPLKKFGRKITPDSPEYGILAAGLLEDVSLVPMKVGKYAE